MHNNITQLFMLLRLPSSDAYFKKYLNTVEEKDYTSEKDDYDPWFLLSTDLKGFSTLQNM
jgi:hypothetical protein